MDFKVSILKGYDDLNENNKFGFLEVLFFLVNTVSVKALLIHPMLISRYGKSASIFMTIYISLLGIVFTIFILRLFNKIKDINIFQNRFILIIFFLFFLTNLSIGLRLICENINLLTFKDSHITFIYIYVFIAMCIGAILGLKSIIRLHAILVPILIIMFITIFTSVVTAFKPNNIFPIFGDGKPLLYYGFIFSSYFSDIISIMFIKEYLKSNISVSKVGIIAQVISSVILIITVSIYLLIMPYPANTNFFMPLYQIERYLEKETILARLEALFSPLWFTAFFLYLSSMLCILKNISLKFIKKSECKYLIVPLAFLSSIIALAIKQESLLDFTMLNFHIKLFTGFFISIIVLIFAQFRREKS